MATKAVGVETRALEESTTRRASCEFDHLFHAQYGRIVRLIAGVIRDPARAEDLAIEVFLKLWRIKPARMEKPEAWLHRAAVRKAIDELRRQTRRMRYESLFRFANHAPTPEELRSAAEEQERVRAALAAMSRRDAEILLLRSNGLSYDDMAAALKLKAASIGTLLSRAQRNFRKEYIKRYGEQ